jgi:hypothetical protein
LACRAIAHSLELPLPIDPLEVAHMQTGRVIQSASTFVTKFKNILSHGLLFKIGNIKDWRGNEKLTEVSPISKTLMCHLNYSNKDTLCNYER